MVHRNRTLDGLRGCLAVLVLVNHALQTCGYSFMFKPAGCAVFAFFTISGYVLTKAWDGHYFAFLLRRAVRLWPVYALCLTAGALLLKTPLPLSLFVWLPVSTPDTSPVADPPAWSLSIEAWAMLGMPAYVWVSRRSATWLAGVSAVLACLSLSQPPLMMGCFFFAGAWLTRYEFRWAPLERTLPQWLGRISYPLYLCHWPILAGLGLPLIASIPLAFAVAEILTRTVERGSIRASRAVMRGNRDFAGALQAS